MKRHCPIGIAEQQAPGTQNMEDTTTQLISPEEFTSFMGLRLVEKLLLCGQWIPAREIKNSLPDIEYLQMMKLLVLAKMMDLDSTYEFLKDTCVPIRSFRDLDGTGNELLNDAVDWPKRLERLISVNKTLGLFGRSDLVTATQLAAKCGNRESLLSLLNAWSSERMTNEVNDIDYRKMYQPPSFRAPLYLAAKHGKAECVRVLLDQGFHVDGPRVSSKTPLFVACEGGHLETVNILIEAGADISRVILKGTKLLPTMFSAGYKNCAWELLKAGVRNSSNFSKQVNNALAQLFAVFNDLSARH